MKYLFLKALPQFVKYYLFLLKIFFFFLVGSSIDFAADLRRGRFVRGELSCTLVFFQNSITIETGLTRVPHPATSTQDPDESATLQRVASHYELWSLNNN